MTGPQAFHVSVSPTNDEVFQLGYLRSGFRWFSREPTEKNISQVAYIPCLKASTLRSLW